MTFAMMWVHGDSVLAAADGAVTRHTRTEVESGVTALGQRDEFKGYAVSERAMKLAMLENRALVVGAGDKDAIVATVDALQKLLVRGVDVPTAVETLGGTLKRRLNAHVLIGSMANGCPTISELRDDHPVVHHREGVFVAGSLAHDVMVGMIRGANDIDPATPAPWALASTQTTMHMASSLEPDMLRRGIGGVVCGALIGPSGLIFQPKTVWVFTDEALLDAVIADRDEVNVGGVVVSVVGENLHYVRSSYFEHEQEAVFIGIPSPLSDEEVSAWADQQRSAMESPELIVFMNLMKRNALMIPNASMPGCPVGITEEPFSIGIEARLAPVIRRAMMREPDAPEDVAIVFYQWWVHGTQPADV